MDNKLKDSEFIVWLRSDTNNLFSLNKPTNSEVLYANYVSLNQELSDMRASHVAKGDSCIDAAKKRDELAKRFNATQDVNERLTLLEQMKPYEIMLKKWHDEYTEIQKKEAEAEIMYKRYQDAKEVDEQYR